MRDNETLETAATRVLRARTGLEDIHLEQLQSFSSIDRHPDDLTITTAFCSLIRPDDYQLALREDELEVNWFPIGGTPMLIFDHDKILEWAITRLQYKTQHKPIGLHLLPEKFTLLELQRLDDSISGMTYDKPNFRRKIMKAGLLLDCNEKQVGGAHRAASLFKFDPSRYQQLSKDGLMRSKSIFKSCQLVVGKLVLCVLKKIEVSWRILTRYILATNANKSSGKTISSAFACLIRNHTVI